MANNSAEFRLRFVDLVSEPFKKLMQNVGSSSEAASQKAVNAFDAIQNKFNHMKVVNGQVAMSIKDIQ